MPFLFDTIFSLNFTHRNKTNEKENAKQLEPVFFFVKIDWFDVLVKARIALWYAERSTHASQFIYNCSIDLVSRAHSPTQFIRVNFAVNMNAIYAEVDTKQVHTISSLDLIYIKEKFYTSFAPSYSMPHKIIAYPKINQKQWNVEKITSKTATTVMMDVDRFGAWKRTRIHTLISEQKNNPEFQNCF